MPRIKYDIKVAKNEGLIISPSELLEKYFTGTPLKSPSTGQDISMEQIKGYIKDYQDNLEDYLSIKFQKQEIFESSPFIRRDFEEWGFIPLSYPVLKPVRLFGFINNIRQVTYPPEWLSAKTTNDGKGYQRRLYIVPGSNSAPQSNSVAYSGVTPNLGFMGSSNIPDYWRTYYQTGFDIVPRNIIQVVAKLAAIPIFAIIGDILLGPGISAKSISLDGLSQSVSTVATGKNSIYGARIAELTREVEKELINLKSVYVGYKFLSC